MRGYPSGYPYKRFLLTLSREVRWQAGVLYGYPHLSSTKGKRARWRPETNIVFCTFCHAEIASPVTCGEYLMVIRTFRQPRRMSRWYRDDVGRPILIIFWKFLQVLLPSSKDIQVRRRARFFSARQGWSSSIACGNVMVIPFYCFQGTEVLLTLLMPFLFFLNDRFRWLGYWSAEWCSARTKLVSYLYFAFISNKR